MMITNHFVPRSARSNLTANLIFVSALAIAFIRSITAPQQFYFVEGFVLLHLILAFFLGVTSGAWFAFVDGLTSFLDGRFTAEIFTAVKGATDAEAQMMLAVPMSQLGRAYIDLPPLQVNYRETLISVAAALNLWFWTAGFQSLQRAGDNCRTYIFFFAPVALSVAFRSLFIAIAAIYLAFHVLVLWTILPISDIIAGTPIKNVLMKAFDPKSPTERASPKKTAGSTILEHMQSARKSAITRRIHFLLHFFVAGWTTINIVYSILAVELVLAWNDFQNVYEVNSTGQFIPMFIGLTALVKAALSALIAHDVFGHKAPPSPSDIKVERSSALFKYWISPRKHIAFTADLPGRRKSMDDDGKAPEIMEVLEHQPLAPVLPILSEWEDSRLEDTLRMTPVPRVLRNTGRYVPADVQGNTHVFHTHKIERRISWDGSLDRPEPSLPPHRMRLAFHVPLKTLGAANEHERQRRRWFKRKVRRLEKVFRCRESALLAEKVEAHRHNSNLGARKPPSRVATPNFSARHLSTNEILWLPPDLNNETLFTKNNWRQRTASSISDVVSAIRRYSADEMYDAYSSTDEHKLPFLRESGLADSDASSSVVYVRRSRSIYTDTTDDNFFHPPAPSVRSLSTDGSGAYRSRESMIYTRRPSVGFEGQQSHNSERPSSFHAHGPREEDQHSNYSTETKRPSYLAIICIRTCAAVANVFCLCGLCVQLFQGYTSLHNLYDAWLYERRMQRHPGARSGPLPATETDLDRRQLHEHQDEQFACRQCDRYLRRQAATRTFWTIHPSRSTTIAPQRLPLLTRPLIPEYNDLRQVLRLDYTSFAIKWAAIKGFRLLIRLPGFEDLGRLLQYRLATLTAERRALKAAEEKKGHEPQQERERVPL